MSGLKDLIKGSPVQERRMEFRSYPVKDDQVVVDGWLRDERFVDGFHTDGRHRPAGVQHLIGARLLVGGTPITILDAETEMIQYPYELCPTAADAVKKLIGLPIASGFSKEVRSRMGGVKGCAHMTTLLLAMGPAVHRGYWTQHAQQARSVPRTLEDYPRLSSIVNSCMVWKEDGPRMQQLRDSMPGPEKTE